MISFKIIIQALLVAYLCIVYSSAFVVYGFVKNQIYFYALVFGIGSLLFLIEFGKQKPISERLIFLILYWVVFCVITAINNGVDNTTFVISLLAQIGFGMALSKVNLKWVFIIFNG